MKGKVAAFFTFSMILLVVALSAGDLKIVMIKYYNDPNWRAGSLALSDEYFNKMYLELKGEAGKRELEAAGCKYLVRLYNGLTGTGGYTWLARRIAAMSDDDLYVYLVNDQYGLTTVMKDFAGLCDYDDPNDDENLRYTWPCAHAKPERAVKIGEHFAEQFVTQLLKRPIALQNEDHVLVAYSSMFLGKLMHTITDAPWQPNDLVLKPNPVSASFLEFVNKNRGSKEKPKYTQALTLMPTSSGANMRAMEIFIASSTSNLARSLYDYFFYDKGFFAILDGSEAHRNLSGTPNPVILPGNHIGYSYKSISLDKLVFNEVFIALAARYTTPTQPPVEDVFGDKIYSLVQVLQHFETNREASVGAVDVLNTLMENYAKTATNEQIKQRRLFIIGLLDLLSHFSAGKDIFEALLDTTLIPSNEIGGLLNTYFGSGSESPREAIKKKVAQEGELFNKVRVLAKHFQQKDYTVFKQ